MPTVFLRILPPRRRGSTAVRAPDPHGRRTDAMAEESVRQWQPHRVIPWPGAGEDAPDYVCAVGVNDLRSWSGQAAERVGESHGDPGGLVPRIRMVVSEDVT